MRRMIVAVMSVVLFTPVFSFGQMDQMEKQMKDHMGGGMMGNSSKEKESEDKGTKALTKEAEAAGVTVKATYENPSAGKKPVFKVVFDTHSVDLDRYKIEDVTILRDDKGKDYRPELISASGSGHHRQADLEFKDADISSSEWVELVIEGVAGVDERVLRFETGNKMMK
ncbi:MAG: hypothetical protein HY889_07115 [Deltaproteobacteria bacterium]|nr:hypothetical protein [Deltaproteobacteria bacterium]